MNIEIFLDFVCILISGLDLLGIVCILCILWGLERLWFGIRVDDMDCFILFYLD